MTDQDEKPPPPPIGYTLEGEGVVATCKRCGWALWRDTRHSAEAGAAGHVKCRADLVALTKRLSHRRRLRA